MHYGARIVFCVQVLDPIQIIPHEVGLCAWQNVVPIDSHVIVSICSGLLVPETWNWFYGFFVKKSREKNLDLQAFKSTKAKLPLFLDILQNVIKWRKEKSIYPKIGAVNFALSECTKVINSLVIPCWVLGFRFAKKWRKISILWVITHR